MSEAKRKQIPKFESAEQERTFWAEHDSADFVAGAVLSGELSRTYSINVTLDGCCDHRAMIADEDVHRHAAENLDRADARFFRNEGGERPHVHGRQDRNWPNSGSNPSPWPPA